MIRSLLPICLLALSSCSEAASSGSHRLDPRPGDDERIAAGELPILILQDGEPCPDALFRSEEFLDHAGWIVSASVVASGIRDIPFSSEDPNLTRADDRGIVWWRPDPDHWIWWLRASHGERTAALPQTRGLLPDAWSAARSGFLHIRLELLPQRDWPLKVSGFGDASVQDVPIFLGTAVDQEVLTRLAWQSSASVRGFEPAALSENCLIWAGLDRFHAIPWPGAPAGDLTFDLTACGSLEIEIFDADGAPVREPRAVFVDEADAEWSWAAPSSAANSPSVVAQNGRAIMHGVPTGKRWHVGSYLLPEGTLVALEVAGPSQPGERIRVRLAAAEASQLLQGRLMGPDGRPESSMAWSVSFGSADIRFRTNADGSFRVRIPQFILDGDRPLRLEHSPWGEPIRLYALDQAGIRASTPETVWTWSEEPFFALGRVLNEVGQPVPFIDLSSMDEFGMGADTQTNAVGRFILKPVEGQAKAWMELDSFSPWHLDHQLMIQAGQRDAVLTVSTGARVLGRLLRGKPDGEFEFQVLRRGASEFETLFSAHNWHGPQGAFEIGPVPLDAIGVRIDCGDDGVAVLKDLQLEAGKAFKLPKPVRPAKIQPAK